MLRFTLDDLSSTSVEDKLVRGLTQNFISLQAISGRLTKGRVSPYHSLRPAVKAQECYMLPKKHEQTPAELVYIRSRGSAKQPAWLFRLPFIGNALVLEQHVVLECYSSKPRKNRRTHKMMRVRPKSINDICGAGVSLIVSTSVCSSNRSIINKHTTMIIRSVTRIGYVDEREDHWK